MDELESIIADAPDNFVIRNALVKCYEVVHEHSKIICSVSGGGDSDVMLDMLLRCGAKEKTAFVFFNTGLEYQATLEHLRALEDKYGITIEKIRHYCVYSRLNKKWRYINGSAHICFVPDNCCQNRFSLQRMVLVLCGSRRRLRRGPSVL